jgi:hypothetical protein
MTSIDVPTEEIPVVGKDAVSAVPPVERDYSREVASARSRRERGSVIPIGQCVGGPGLEGLSVLALMDRATLIGGGGSDHA